MSAELERLIARLDDAIVEAREVVVETVLRGRVDPSRCNDADQDRLHGLQVGLEAARTLAAEALARATPTPGSRRARRLEAESHPNPGGRCGFTWVSPSQGRVRCENPAGHAAFHEYTPPGWKGQHGPCRVYVGHENALGGRWE